ncbi:MAG: HD domain-containing protein [Clostridia bacterium]|nr:HD domain-containing protein [Clostridia bacterium]
MYEELVTKELLEYIKNNIFQVYDLNGKSHDINHIKYVLERAYEISMPYKDEINYDILYTAVAYHDIGDHIDRANHEKVSANWMANDEKLKEFFSPEQIEIIKQAIEDHRSSREGEPRNVYGKILTSADKNIDVDTFFIRTYEFGLEHYKELDTQEQLDRAYEHAVKKYGKHGYAVHKYYVKDEKYFEYLKELQRLIDNKEEFYKRAKEVLKIS